MAGEGRDGMEELIPENSTFTFDGSRMRVSETETKIFTRNCGKRQSNWSRRALRVRISRCCSVPKWKEPLANISKN